MYRNIPFEMQNYPQWVAWRYVESDKKPRKVPFDVRSKKNASTVNPTNWATFNEVVDFITKNQGYGIGFVLTQNDPFVCIDLDHSDDPAITNYQYKILDNFKNTYIEMSPSGKGYHIWTKGEIQRAVKTKTCEIYNHSRFITFTGNVVVNANVNENTNGLNALVNEFGKVELNKADSDPFRESLAQERVQDHKIIEYINSIPKASDLYNGYWQHHFTSQSEADLCLMGMIADVSRNVEQTIRLFRMSDLGKRDKAKRDDYIRRTVEMAFSNLQPIVEVDLEFLKKKKNESKIDFSFLANVDPVLTNDKGKNKLKISNEVNEGLIPRTINKIIDNGELPEFVEKTNFGIPKGLVLEIAKYLYAQSIRPMREPCIAAAMSLMSAICGRSYNVNGAGVNQYIVVLAPTGSGKDSLNKGISELIQSVSSQIEDAWNFLGTADIVSETALIQYFEKVCPSFMVLYQDFGLTLKGWCDKREGRQTTNIRKMLLNLYGESGRKGSIRPRRFADSNKNTGFVRSPALTILADSTPERFYEVLTDDIIEEGLIPRFSILEATCTKRPKPNPYANTVSVNPALTANLVALISNSNTINRSPEHEPIDIPLTNEAQLMLDEFNDYCDNQIDNLTGAARQLWNRSHLKALKIAALFAIGENIYTPQITKEHAKFAIDWVRNETTKLHSVVSKGISGRVDGNQSLQLEKLATMLIELIMNEKSNLNNDMRKNATVPYRMIVGKLLRQPAFAGDKRGAAKAVKDTLRTLIDGGFVMEVSKATAFEKYKITNGVLYQVVMLEQLIDEFGRGVL